MPGLHGINRLTIAVGVTLLVATLPLPARAGAGNPNLSVIAQPRLTVTTDPADPGHDRPVWDIGETEFVLDDYLNPYIRGNLTLAYTTEEGLALEESTIDVVRGLPGTLNLRVGKWRSGFGKLNPQHPHVYPFAERFGVLAAYLPGEEGLNETGMQASLRLPSPGDIALTASADWLQGDSFRRERQDTGLENDPLSTTEEGDRPDEPRPAALLRLSAFAPVGERSGLELGVSGTEGTNNVAAGTTTRVFGIDAKAKLWNSERSYLLLQGEALKLTREDAGWDGFAYTSEEVTPWGWYLFADYNWGQRWNAGASYERFQQDTANPDWNRSVGLFAGFAVMEETTALRLDWRREQTGAPEGAEDNDAIDVVTLRVIWSMGPHKAHQF
jgi:hypothetical protein